MTGKNAQGLKGFPTPQEISPTEEYLLFRFPSGNDWAGLLLGAAQALAFAYNFYEWGAMLPEEAAEEWRRIIEEAPYRKIECELPEGTPFFRLGAGGEIEQYNGVAWVEPEGAYALPNPATRSEPTDYEKQCAAAANAAYVLKQLYEELTDSWNAHLSEADAAVNFLELGAILCGIAFAPVIGALIAIGVMVFSVVYDTLEFIGADLWTSDFDEKLVCILLDCSSLDGSTVVFDYDCVISEIANATNILDITASEIRLFGQLQYMLGWLGAQGLNVAGGTTEIEDADCSPCGDHIEMCAPDGYGTLTYTGGASWSVAAEAFNDGGVTRYRAAINACENQENPCSGRTPFRQEFMLPTIGNFYMNYCLVPSGCADGVPPTTSPLCYIYVVRNAPFNLTLNAYPYP